MSILSEQPTKTGLETRARETLAKATDVLLSMQREDGHWRAELEGDSILQSEYILMRWIVGQERDDPRLPKLITYLRQQQREEDGAWIQFPGSAPDVSATVKGWVCLRLAGDDPSLPHMQRAEAVIRAAGGAEACNSYSRFFLACLGLIDWDAVPSIPPEILYLPRWSPFHLDHMSAWSRTMIMPLAICTALRPTRRLPESVSIRHLFHDTRYMHELKRPEDAGPLGLTNAFIVADRMLKHMQREHAIPTRAQALRDAEAWITERADAKLTDGLGAIFPPLVYTIIAFRALGYPVAHPVIAETDRQLTRFAIEEADTMRLEPCFSPVWDTGIALYALTEAGLSEANDTDGASVQRASAWLRAKQTTLVGDWSRSAAVDPGGWSFEYLNEFYPDVDDTAMVAMSLHRAGGEPNRVAGRKGIDWLIALQNDDGGWAAFDKTQNRPLLEAVPFADHNAIQDPSCADITGRTLESLAWYGYTLDDECVRRALAYVRLHQEPEGCWFGRWGVNYIYGTWQALCGLRRIGQDMSEAWVQRAGEWLQSVQQRDGGFGESALSYEDPSLKGVGPATPSQTAWAAISLHEIYGRDHPALQRAIRWLIEHQLDTHDDEGNPPGSWTEREYTGTGFPRVFYLRYHLYRHYFPMIALGRYLRDS